MKNKVEGVVMSLRMKMLGCVDNEDVGVCG